MLDMMIRRAFACSQTIGFLMIINLLIAVFDFLCDVFKVIIIILIDFENAKN